MQSLKEMLPKTTKNSDAVVLELIKRLLGQGSTINITINNHIAKKLAEPKKDVGDSVFEDPKSIKAENNI